MDVMVCNYNKPWAREQGTIYFWCKSDGRGGRETVEEAGGGMREFPSREAAELAAIEAGHTVVPII